MCKQMVVRRNGANFSQCSVTWGGFPWDKFSGCHRVRFWLLLCFFLMEEVEEKEKKTGREKTLLGRRVSWGWTCLAGCAAGCNC
jgi:hypothetical protein